MVLIEAVRDYLKFAEGGTDTAAQTKAAFENLKRLHADLTFADAALLDAARDRYALGSNDDVEIDDGAVTSVGDGGTWVQAWVWIANEEEEGG